MSLQSKPLFDPIQNVFLEFRHSKNIVRLFNPLHRMSRLGRHLFLFIVFFQLTLGEERFVGYAIPAGVIGLINAIVRIQCILKKVSIGISLLPFTMVAL